MRADTGSGPARRDRQDDTEDRSVDRFAALTLEQLIAGRPGIIEEALERSVSFGWDLDIPRAVLLSAVDPPVDPDAVGVALGTMAAAARATLGPGAIVWVRRSTVAALIDPVDDAASTRRQLADRMQRELDLRLRTVSVSIGVGRRVDDPHDLRRSFAEARRAVDVGRWAKGRHVTEVYDDLGLERLLASTSPEELADYVEQTIGPLVDLDRRQAGDLVESLAVWLETRNVAAAARRLHVHYNTMKNRLDRIEQIIGPVFDDPRRLLECEIAVYVHRHHLAPGS